MKKYVSIDIGGTAIKYGVIDESGSIVVKDKMDTEAYKGGPEILKKVTGIVAGYMDTYEPSGIAISTAGMVDVEKGEIFYSASRPARVLILGEAITSAPNVCIIERR